MADLPTLRDVALSVKCPDCGAVPGEDCVAMKYDPVTARWRAEYPHRRTSPHAERLHTSEDERDE